MIESNINASGSEGWVFFDRFRKDEVIGTKVLICALGSGFDDLLKQDAEIYKTYYSAITETFTDVNELMSAIRGNQYDVVHLLCELDSIGQIAGRSTSGTVLIEHCCAAGVKLLWVASESKPEPYIKGFRARGARLNLVMTLTRNGPELFRFSRQAALSDVSWRGNARGVERIVPTGPRVLPFRSAGMYIFRREGQRPA